MTDTFPRQHARTQRFTLGVPRSFQISPDGKTVAFLRSKSGDDPVTCLWVLDVGTGTERLVVDPAEIGAPGLALDPDERARRERSREQAAGIVGFAADGGFRTAAFGLSGKVYAVDLAGGGSGLAGGGDGLAGGGDGVRELPARTPAADPRPDPTGRLVAYVCAGALRVVDTGTGDDRVIAEPGAGTGMTFGLAEFVAAEEMGRSRGYWWAPDGQALLVARVDAGPVQRWHIADPSHPEQPATEVRYPAAGTPNAEVCLFLAGLDGALTPVEWDRAAFPYLVTACWEGAGHAEAAAAGAPPPLIVVQSRDQRQMRILELDTATGGTSVIRSDTSENWLEIVPGAPARTAAGKIAWTADAGSTRRLLVASAAELTGGTAVPVTPEGLQVREIVGVDGDVVLFTASDGEPTEIGLWSYGPDGLAAVAGGGQRQVRIGCVAGGTTVAACRSLDFDGVTVQVLRGDAEVARIASHAQRPMLAAPSPVLFSAGPREIRTALLLPSWHRTGSAALPVLMDPYGGPHAQMVLASRASFLISQWFAEQGFAVVVADGRGTPGRGPDWEHAVAGDLAGPPLADQVTALEAAAARCGDLDLSKVAIRGWSFGGYLAALAVLRRPDIFHAAVAGAPVTEMRLYDTHYTERYLGHPGENPEPYDRCSLLSEAHKLRRPLMIIHGLADDNVVVAHSLRLSTALLAAGRQHCMLPLSGVTHMAAQAEVAENLLLLQVNFLRDALGAAARQAG
jgi:dipeptidyl-peptidase-4